MEFETIIGRMRFMAKNDLIKELQNLLIRFQLVLWPEMKVVQW